MNCATNLAKKSEQRHKHACIIVRGGAIQSYGVNVYRNQPGIVKEVEELGVHAEIRALRACTRTDGSVLYVARVNNAGEPKQSRPCNRCIKAITAAGIKRVVYTINESMNLGV